MVTEDIAKKIDNSVWEISKDYKKGMNVPARIIANSKLLKEMDDGVVEQITNVACLPGIQRYAFAMADAHFGYGFPVGGVAAFDLEEGVISPGGIGFDINCGMRLLTTNLTVNDIKPKIKELVSTLYDKVPCGVGKKSRERFSVKQLDEISIDGVKWCVENGYGWKEDEKKVEEHGKIKGADPTKVSTKAKQRGQAQVGTLGSGNHYLEVQVVTADSIFNEEIAQAFGIHKNQIVVMVHCGSRGYGHQIATDYLRDFDKVMKKYNLTIKDRELSCAPFSSDEGRDYYKAMVCAANYAFANRQLILHRIRQSFESVFKMKAEDMEMNMVYDIAHNIAKIERYKIEGKMKDLLVHRKGATRSFGPGNKELWGDYSKYGQPVIIGGSMETGSYLLVGTQKAEEETFGSTVHGSGRVMSRKKAKTLFRGEKLQRDMEKRGIYVKTASFSGLAEEAGNAYKDINDVVKSVELAGLNKPVASFRPIGNIKG